MSSNTLIMYICICNICLVSFYRAKKATEIHRCVTFITLFSTWTTFTHIKLNIFKSEVSLCLAVDIHLNHRTAHACLSVSDTKKQVRHTNKQQEVPENPKRFDRVTNVLSKEAFISGRHYWEVKVSEKTDWDVGLAKQSVNRKGKFAISPVNGFWMLSLKNGNQYTANTLPQTNLTLNVRPKTLAIYLDYEEGQLSFFCLESGTHIYTFTDSFTDKLHPIFNPGRPHGTKNTEPLIISSSCCTI